jgi:hypothetical protein
MKQLWDRYGITLTEERWNTHIVHIYIYEYSYSFIDMFVLNYWNVHIQKPAKNKILLKKIVEK